MKNLKHSDLWKRYKEDNDLQAKNELVEKFTPLVIKNAKKYLRSSPNLIDLDDLIQSGMIGLMQSMEKFDMERENKFETFANRRISGSILDDINKLDWTPRAIRSNIRTYLKALEIHHGQSPNPPTDEELSAVTHKEESLNTLTAQGIKTARQQSKKTYLGSVDAEFNQANDTSNPKEEIINSTKTDTPEDLFQHEYGAVQALSKAQKVLSEKELLLIKHRYFDNKSLKDIGVILKVPASQITFIHKEAIRKLRLEYGVDENSV